MENGYPICLTLQKMQRIALINGVMDMPIIFPDICKGKTSGGLREVKEKGYTTASKGYFDIEFIKRDLIDNPDLYFKRTEPAGIFMSKLEESEKQINEAATAIWTASHKLVENAKEANKQMSDVTGKFRDGTEKLSSAIDKLMKVVDRGDFAETVGLTKSLVDSLERLADLEEKGLLDKVIRAMRG